MEGRYRTIKKEAAKLKSEVESGQRPEAPKRGNGGAGSAQSTPRKPRGTPKKEEGTSLNPNLT